VKVSDTQALEIDNRDCVRCMHCINVMTGGLAPGEDKGATILVGGKRTLKIGDLMGTVVVPFMKLATDEDREKLVDLAKRIVDFFAENALEHERTGEMIERIGLVNFLEASRSRSTEHGQPPAHQSLRPHRRLGRRSRPHQGPQAGRRLSVTRRRRPQIMSQPQMRRRRRVRRAGQHAVPAPDPEEELRQLENHDRPRPGVLHHVSTAARRSGRCAPAPSARWTSTRSASCATSPTSSPRAMCASPSARTSSSWCRREEGGPADRELEKNGFPVGGTGNSVSMIAHTQGWLHCDIPGTDASGVVKALMDELYEEFKHEEMPNRVRLSTSCCEINCGGQADIAIIIQHTKPPKINHDLVANVCERPAVVARCPVAAIRPALVNGKPTLEVDEKKCVCCGACYPPCPPMQINDPEHSKLAIWVGGKNSNARGKPTVHEDGRRRPAEQPAALAGSRRRW
jgi:dissimilatory sulfite reductase (desulfoviridin) alpha/beta subunit